MAVSQVRSIEKTIESLKRLQPGSGLDSVLAVLRSAIGTDGLLLDAIRVEGPKLSMIDSPAGLPDSFAEQILVTMPLALDDGVEDISVRLALGLQQGDFLRDIDIGMQLMHEYPLYNSARDNGIGTVNILKLHSVKGFYWHAHESLFLYRELGRPRFTEEEIKVLDEIGPALRMAIRRCALVLRPEAWLTELIESKDLGCLTFSRNGRLLQANDRAVKLLSAYGLLAQRELVAGLEKQLHGWLSRPELHVIGRHKNAELLAECIVAEDAIAVVLEEQVGEKPAFPLDGLSKREMEVAMALVTQPVPAADLAASLKLAPATLRKHTEKIFRKLDVHSRMELRMLWLKGTAE